MDQREAGGHGQPHVVHQALRRGTCAAIGAVQGDESQALTDAASVDGVAKIVQPCGLAQDQLDACRFTRG